MSPVLVLLLLSPLLLSLLIVGVIVCIAIVRVAPADVQGVLGLLVKLLACLGKHFPHIGAARAQRSATAPGIEEVTGASDAGGSIADGDAQGDGAHSGQNEEVVA